MHTFKTVLSGKSLLATSIALLSGSALAEVAGRVSFVHGSVSASSLDGVSRELRRGDLINGGDRISTQAGRLQIRFSDGGFVSLQPHTLFGVDEYLYANRKPEESSLFFSLLQGGMRTITGAIGKVNKQSYKVRTPVATIGIRGTEYLASLTDRGLFVSVGAGFVTVANSGGSTAGGSGQSIFVPNDESIPALSDEGAELQASGVEGDLQEAQEEVAEDSSEDQGLDGDVAVGNVQNERGEYIFLFTTDVAGSLQSSDLANGSPRYYISSPRFGNTTNAGNGLLVTFDGSGYLSGTQGALLQAYAAGKNPGSPNFDSGSLLFHNVETLGGLSWGEFTNGTSSLNSLFNSCTATSPCYNPINLTSSEFIPYIVGLAPVSRIAGGSATYMLQGGSTPRGKFGAGTLDSFIIRVNFDFSSIDLAMQVTLPDSVAGTTNTYKVQTLSSQPVGVLNLAAADEFFLSSGALEVTDTSNSCMSSGVNLCSATISGFFAGPIAAQIATSYEINNSNVNENISGVAALGMNASSVAAATAAPDGAGYSLAFAKDTSVGASTGFFGGYDDKNNDTLNSLTNAFDTAGGLMSARQGGADTLLIGTAKLADTGRQGNLDWGRWYGGDITLNGSLTTLSPLQSLHYITGPMTQPGFFDAVATSPQFGAGSTATYTYQNGSPATGSDGSTGTVASGSKLMVTFGSNPTVDVDMGINMTGTKAGLYQLSGSGIGIGISGNTGTATFSAATGSGISLSGSACSSTGCLGASAAINGFIAGASGQQIGVGYQIIDTSRTVNGAAAFGRSDITPPPAPVTSTGI